MLPNVSAIALGLLLLTLQSSPICPDFGGMGSPDLYLCLVVYLGVNREIAQGAIPLVVVSFLADIHAASPIGLHMVSSTILFLLLQLLRVRLVLRGIGSGVVLVVFASAISSLLVWFFTSIFVASFDGGVSLLRFAFPRALLTALFAVPILWLMHRLDSWGVPGKKRAPVHLSLGALLRKN